MAVPNQEKQLLSREEVYAKALDLFRQGWTVIPADDPRRAMHGVAAFRTIHKETGRPISPQDTYLEEDYKEECRLLEWPIYDRPLDPEVEAVGPAELHTFLQDRQAVVWDNPKKLTFGAVRYFPEEGKALAKYCRLTQMKAYDKMLEYNDLRMARQKAGSQSSLRLVEGLLLAELPNEEG